MVFCLVDRASEVKDRSRVVFADPFTHICTSEAIWLVWMGRGRGEGEVVSRK